MQAQNNDELSKLISAQMDDVTDVFKQSSPLRTAASILLSAVMEPGLNKLDYDAEAFIKDSVQKLFLFGFYIYKVSRKRGENGKTVFKIMDHSKLSVTYDDRKLTWIPVVRTNEKDSETGLVRMIMWRHPTLEFGLQSPAFQAITPAMRLEEVFENIRIRDEQNSHRAVYTSLAEMETTSSGQPWFAGASHQGYTGAYGYNNSELDIDELIENRESTHQKLSQLTATLRSRSFGSEAAGMGFASLDGSIAKEHNELMVDAGSKAVFQASHLAGENDNMRLVRTLQIDLFISAGVPPQAAGINSNTERVAGSEKITNVALDSFFSRSLKVRNLIEESVNFLFGVTFLESADPAKLQKVLPILKPKPALRYLSQAYKVEESDIDVERLKIMQDTMLYGQSKSADTNQQNPELTAKANNQNAAKDEEEKEETAQEKTEKSSEEV